MWSQLYHRKRNEPTIDVDLNITLGKAISAWQQDVCLSGYSPNAVDKKIAAGYRQGKYHLPFRHGFTEIDTFEMAVPQGYRLEKWPRECGLMETLFGSYQLIWFKHLTH